jgi:hypothetical protein
MPVLNINGSNGPLTVFMCTRGRSKPCATCGRPSTKLCDFPLGNGKTCDAAICDGCATGVGMGLDYCPKHKDMQPPQGNLFEVR